MKNTKQLVLISLFTGLLMGLSACQTPGPSPDTSLKKEINEVRPGILQGYLAQEDIPDSLKLVSAPPETGMEFFN